MAARTLSAQAPPLMHVSALYLYPIKACAGIAVNSAQLTRRGFMYDRRWMIADKDGQFVSQRQVKSLALVRTAIAGDTLVLDDDLRLPLQWDGGETTAVRIWKDDVEACVHEEGSAWFSAYLQQEVSLVYMPDTVERQVDLKFGKPGDVVSFADAYPLLVISEASLDDLNARIGAPAPLAMDRFRPNIVIADCPAYTEDTLSAFSIAGVSLRGVKPCTRCVVTTIDQTTGIAGKEPLATLATYKRAPGGGVVFGMNVIHDALGAIRVGDDVRV